MGPMTPIRFVTTEEIRGALTMPAAIHAVKEALVGLSTGRALVPARTSREIPGETVRRAALFVEERRSALEEAGDILIPLREGLIGEAHIRAEIGQVLAGLAPGRRSDDETTLFKSVGNAVEDLAVAALVLG